MGDKKTKKRPAHELILESLETRVMESNIQVIYDNSESQFRINSSIMTLLEVMGQMIIPEKERDQVLKTLLRIKDLARQTDIKEKIEMLRRFLIEEK